MRHAETLADHWQVVDAAVLLGRSLFDRNAEDRRRGVVCLAAHTEVASVRYRSGARVAFKHLLAHVDLERRCSCAHEGEVDERIVIHGLFSDV